MDQARNAERARILGHASGSNPNVRECQEAITQVAAADAGKLVATLVNKPPTPVATKGKAKAMAEMIIAAINPYSMAVTPRRSVRHNLNPNSR